MHIIEMFENFFINYFIIINNFLLQVSQINMMKKNILQSYPEKLVFYSNSKRVEQKIEL